MSKSEVTATQRMLNVWAIVLIAWSLYRATFKSELPIWFDEFIAKPLVFLTPLYLYITHTEKQSLFRGLGFGEKDVLTDILFGLCMGGVFVGIAFFTRILKGLAPVSLQISSESFLWVGATVVAAGMEQVLSTGFVFKRLVQESKNVFQPMLTSAVLFFFLHIPVLFGADKISGSYLIQMMLLNTVLSFITSTVFVMRKNIVAPILIHALYLLSLPILL